MDGPPERGVVAPLGSSAAEAAPAVLAVFAAASTVDSIEPPKPKSPNPESGDGEFLRVALRAVSCPISNARGVVPPLSANKLRGAAVTGAEMVAAIRGVVAALGVAERVPIAGKTVD